MKGEPSTNMQERIHTAPAVRQVPTRPCTAEERTDRRALKTLHPSFISFERANAQNASSASGSIAFLTPGAQDGSIGAHVAAQTRLSASTNDESLFEQSSKLILRGSTHVDT